MRVRACVVIADCCDICAVQSIEERKDLMVDIAVCLSLVDGL